MSAKETVRENSMKYKLKDGVLFHMVNKKSKKAIPIEDLLRMLGETDDNKRNDE